MTTVLHDAPGRVRHITIIEEMDIRSLLLDGCEEGAMHLQTDEPVCNYIYFHKCSFLAPPPLGRALCLGAGTFTAAKCLALDHPAAEVDVVDIEPELEPLGRQFFGLDRPEFARIRFHGVPAEEFLPGQLDRYDFIFDDIFDGYQHVPIGQRGVEHVAALKSALREEGVCVKNLIWNPLSAKTRGVCTEAMAAFEECFSCRGILSLGDPGRGHNLMLFGRHSAEVLDLSETRRRLVVGGFPRTMEWKSPEYPRD